MLFTNLLACSSLLGASIVHALPSARPLLEHRQTCTNTATTRGCWDGNYTIATDAETEWPTTGHTVSYTLTLTNQSLSPDGSSKYMSVFNGQYPGPAIVANWGDTLQITVVNNLETDSTSMHWHGVVQHNTNAMDGVNGVTECPIPPGASRTYVFQATEYGTSWYHSHHAAQYGDGVAGPIIINGPASANYDYDLGALPVSDLYYASAYTESIASERGPPTADNGLINGTNKNAAGTAGAYNVVSGLIAGATYRLRLINMAVDNHFVLTLDSHIFTVIAADFVPIVPFNTSSIFIGIGQRYDVIFTASETPANYWFRALLPNPTSAEGGACGANSNAAGIKSIFNYEGVTVANPTSTVASDIPEECIDVTTIVPYVVKDVPADSFVWPAVGHELQVDGPNVGTAKVWSINGSSIVIDWANPTLQYVKEGNTSYLPDTNVYELPDADVWAYYVIVNEQNIPHPIHLHGHDFYLLGQAEGKTFTGASQLNFNNPPRRDVAMLPASGFIVIAFQTDNPGAWLLHCHIAWHVGEGLALQFLERASEIPTSVDLSPVSTGCSAYNEWFATRVPTPWNTQFDSGL